MEINQNEWNKMKRDVRRARDASEAVRRDRGHTLIIILLWIIVFKGCL
jgi:hypothetical protein